MLMNMQKAELGFTLNAFNKPAEFSSFTGWTKLILNLLFLEPGTYPSDENIGCGLNKETFKDVDYITGTLFKKMSDQINVYLPDIPFSNMQLDDSMLDDENILILYIHYNTIGGITTVTVATSIIDDQIDYRILL